MSLEEEIQVKIKLVSAALALALVFVLGSFSAAWAGRPNPVATPGRPLTPPGQENGSQQYGLQQNGKDPKRHGIFGTVKSKGSTSFVVETKQGDVDVTVTSDTRFHIPTKRNATFADLSDGDRVAVNGTPTASGLTAKQVAAAPGKPTIQHRVGQVTGYTAGSSITIQDVQGGSETFDVNAQTVIRNPKGTGVAIGDRVTIVSRRDPSTDAFTATGIVVHPQ